MQTREAPPTGYLTVKEVAEHCRVSQQAVRVWLWEKRMRSVRAGRRWLIRPEWVDAFLSEGEKERL